VLHFASELRECISRGKASAPYEFGVKASIVTTNRRAPAGQFVLHARALPGNPYDGHTLRAAIDGAQKLTGCKIERAHADKGYRGHDPPNPRRVFISGQKRGVFGVIKRELRRRSAIAPVIGHIKTDGHLGRCYLKRPQRRRRQRHPQRDLRFSRRHVPGFFQSVANHLGLTSNINPRRRSAAESRYQFDTTGPNMNVWGAAVLVSCCHSVLAKVVSEIDCGFLDVH
jgi:hypothetical protein